jgi:hypothetical protein
MARQVFKALILLALICSWTTADQDDPKQTGPLALIIQYKCLPGQRAEFRQRLIAMELGSLAKLQSDGVLAEHHVLFSRYVDTNSWDALALLTFHRYADVVRWRRVEESSPAGLTQGTIALTSSIETYPVDLMRQAMAEERPVRPVYLVVPYTYSVPVPAYLKYVDDYVSPQFKGWMQEGILSGYQLYLQRYTAARPWDTLIFLQYKDDESFGQREKIVAKVRAQLQGNPVWKAASDNKQSLRVEKEAIIADELAPVR